MRRRDGADVHTRHESQLLTTAAVLDAEARIVALAARTDGIAIDDKHVEIALLESAANGLDLNAGQRSLVRAMATSGAKVQLALAPAGTGKTASMKALTTAWPNAAGRVVGFAPTAAAAAVLRQDILTTTDTLAKFVDITQRLREGRSVKVPQWYTDIGEDTLVIVDEAGMTGTHDLDARADAITGHRDRIAADVATWTPTTAPVWARALLTDEPDIDLLTDLAVFRAAYDVDPADRRARPDPSSTRLRRQSCSVASTPAPRRSSAPPATPSCTWGSH